MGSMAKARWIDAGNIVESPAAPDNNNDFLMKARLDSIITVGVFPEDTAAISLFFKTDKTIRCKIYVIIIIDPLLFGQFLKLLPKRY